MKDNLYWDDPEGCRYSRWCYFSSSSSKSAPVVNQKGLDMLNSNVARVDQINSMPFQSFTGEMTAPTSPNEQIASNVAPGAFFAGAPALNQAQNSALGLTGYQPPKASSYDASAAMLGSAPQIGPVSVNRGNIRDVSSGDLLSGIAKYQDPYNNDVVNSTLNDLDRARQIQRVSDQQHTPTGAFGGSRQGVADAQTNEAYLRTAASTAANLRDQGFRTSAGLAQSDADRALQVQNANQGVDLSVAGQNANLGFGGQQFNAGLLSDFMKQNAIAQNTVNDANAARQTQTSQFNTNADIAGAGVRQGGVGALGAIGGQQAGNYLNALGALQSTGATDRTTQQAADDAAYQEFLRMINYPIQGQQIRNQALGLVPASLGSSGSSSSFGFKLPIPGMG